MEKESVAPFDAHDEIVAAPLGAPMAASMQIRELRRFLQGVWQLARVIEDRRGGQTGVLRGQACVAPDDAGLVLSEAGRLRLGAHAGPAQRRYLYRFPAPERAEVGFADGRPFHDLDLTHGTWEAEHRCGPDLYRGTFQVPDPDVLLVRWAVTGPRKDAILTSRYRRRHRRPLGRTG